MAYKVSVTEECIGCQACIGVCDNFQMGDDNKSHAVNGVVEEIGCNQDAADTCPVDAIKVEKIE